MLISVYSKWKVFRKVSSEQVDILYKLNILNLFFRLRRNLCEK